MRAGASISGLTRLVLVVSTLAACAGPASDSDGATKAADELAAGVVDVGSRTSGAKSDVACRGRADRSLGGGELCVDTGFRAADGFLFANWSSHRFEGDDVTVADMVALFGESSVCSSVTGNVCILNTGAEQLRTKLARQVSGGRCEGLVLLAGLMKAGLVRPSDFGPGVASITDLGPNSPDLVAAVNYWWATQFDPDAVAVAAANRVDDLGSFLRRLTVALGDGSTTTIGIYSGSTGHALLPVAVTAQPDGTYVVGVYDSNFPSEIRSLIVDVARNQWSYVSGDATAGNKDTMVGSAGMIDFTTIEARLGRRTCEGCAGDSSLTSGPTSSIPGIEISR